MIKPALARLIVHATLGGICVVFALPLWWALVSSLRHPESVFRDVYPFSFRAFVPYEFDLAAYESVIGEFGLGRALVNSILVASVTVVGGVVVNGLAGFAFAKFDFKGKRVLFSAAVLSFLVPFEAKVIPLYNIVADLGWTNSYTVLIVPLIPNGLIIFLFRQFFLGVPNELYEAAAVDGARPVRIFASIYLPLTRPAVITAALVLFLSQWEAFLWPLLTIHDEHRWVVQLSLAQLQSRQLTLWPELLAGATVVAAIPILLVLPLQRYFRAAFLSGAVRG